MYNADQLATIIKMAAKMDMPDLGEDEQQDFYIFQWINLYMFQYAKAIRKTKTSDALTIPNVADYVDFLVNGQPISDMYEPYQILDQTDKAAAKRTSFDATTGWYREDAYSKIHTKGLSGVYRLKYIKYPTPITLGTQVPEITPSSYAELVSWVIGKLKLSKNFYQESQAMLADANSVKLAKTKAATAGMGSNAQQPGPDDTNLG